jgi:hypothetical protein
MEGVSWRLSRQLTPSIKDKVFIVISNEGRNLCYKIFAGQQWVQIKKLKINFGDSCKNITFAHAKKQ